MVLFKGYLSTSSADFDSKLAIIEAALSGNPEYTSIAYCGNSLKHTNGNSIITVCSNMIVYDIVKGVVTFVDIDEDDIATE